MQLVQLLRSLRPRQWTKNLVLFAAPIFARRAEDPRLLLHAVLGFCVFCLLSGTVYLFNDLKDRERDRSHPRKRLRPIASGRLRPATAWGALAVLPPLALLCAAWLGHNFLLVAVAYLTLNVLYSLVLRNLVLLDVMAIAAGFVLRAIAGAEVLAGAGTHVTISAWLLVCTFFLSLFLGLTKRRREAAVVDANHRAILRSYGPEFLDRLIAIAAALTIQSYCLYTIWPDTVAKFGTEALVFTVPFVFYGIGRYLFLVMERDKGDDPAEMLLHEKSIMVTVLLWVVCVGWILYRT
jgi:4-hydroxybenzoate polyprenyltransferase